MREQGFESIAGAYNDFYAGLMKKGKLPIRKTARGLWGSTACDAVFGLFEKLCLERFRSFLDLGSGDGKVVLIASLFTKAKGIEFDDELVRLSRGFCDKLNLSADFVRADFMEHDLSRYDFVFINPDNDFSKGLDEKLKRELNGILVCFSMVYKPNLLKKGRTYWVNQMPFTVYTR